MKMKKMLSSFIAAAMVMSTMSFTAFADETDVWDSTTDRTWYTEEDDSYVLNSAEALAGLAELVNSGTSFKGKTVTLAVNVDLEGYDWTPIGSDASYFEGTFDGGNNTVSNMSISIDSTGNVFAGLFGGIKKGTVKNLTMNNVDINATGAKVRAAAVVGIASSNSEYRTDATINFENITVVGCSIDATATAGSALLGGVVGYSYPANMKNINVSDLTIDGNAEGNEVRAAAINGYVCGQNISNNGGTRAPMLVDTFEVSNATINAEGYTVFAGGYAPYTYYGYITLKDGNIDGLKITANAHEAFVGGLVGYFWRSDNGHNVENVDITNIDFDVTTDYLGETRVGGVVGTSQSPNTKYTDVSVSGKIVERCSDSANPVNHHAKVGGFVARTYEYAMQTYTNCVADVDVTGSNVAGGFVGNHTSTVSYVNCEANGDVKAHIAGGFVGRLTNSSYTSAVTFDGCNALGNVEGTVVAGGFIGSTVSYGWEGWGSEKYSDPYKNNVIIKDCETTGNITSGTDYCAGVVGEAVMADGVEIISDNVSYTVNPAFYPENAPVGTYVASIGTKKYTSLNKAMEAANDGDVITLLSDIEISEAKAFDKAITIDLNGYTLDMTAEYGNLSNYGTAYLVTEDVTIENGTVNVSNENKVSTDHGLFHVFDTGSLTFNDVEINSDGFAAFGMFNVYGDLNFVDSEVNVKGTENSERVIYTEDTGYLDIDNSVINAENISVYGIELFTDYSIDDTSVINTTMYVRPTATNITSEVKLAFEPTDDERVYNIYVEATEHGKTINRLSTVQGTFNLTNNKMSYVLAPVDGVQLTSDIDTDDVYVFNFDGDTAPDASGVKILIGTVTFDGYGEFDFKVTDGKVKTALLEDNIVSEYIPNAMISEKQGNLDLNESVITGGNIEEKKNKLTIGIDFNNNITAGKTADYNDMWITVTGSNGDVYTGYVGSGTDTGNVKYDSDYSDARAEWTFDVVTGYRYTVVVKGEGYRTARYTTVVDSDKTLKFWNNALEKADGKVREDYIEEDLQRSLRSVTFLAGDIAQDNIIDKYDLAAVVSYFGYDKDTEKVNMVDYVKYDLNRDGRIDADDISYVLVSWGK